MQERRPTRRARRRGRKRIAFSVIALGLVFAAHHQLASLERTSMAALEEGNAAKKIGARAAQSAAQAAAHAGAPAQNASSASFRKIRNTHRLSLPGEDRVSRSGGNRVSLPGPAAAALAMQLGGNPELQARFRRLQKETATALNEASSQGKDLSALRTPLPVVMGGRALRRNPGH